MKYIDIHCHLNFPDYDTDRAEVLKRMKEWGMGAIIIGASLERSKRAVEIAEASENIWACIGVHPDEATSPLAPLLAKERGREEKKTHSVFSPFPFARGEKRILGASQDSLRFFEQKSNEWTASVRRVGDEVVSELEKLIKSPKVVGVGECGLDYFERRSLGEGGLSQEEKSVQKELFESQIQFALKHDKPLMLHVRDGYADALEILYKYKKEAGEKLRGDVHFFAGNIEVAKKFLDLGFMMSFTGVITFTRDYDDVIKYIPQDRIIAETDAPFVAPVPYRGKRNEPAYVIEVVKKMAEIRGEKPDVLNEQMVSNAKNLFRIGN